MLQCLGCQAESYVMDHSVGEPPNIDRLQRAFVVRAWNIFAPISGSGCNCIAPSSAWLDSMFSQPQTDELQV